MRTGEKFRLALAFGSSLTSYATRGTPRPFSASFAVTDRCNLRCEYCNFPFLETRDLNLPQIERVMDQLRDLGVARLGLVGGEPMVRKDLTDIIALAKARGFFVTINTNLTLWSRFPRSLDAVDHVFTSLDGDPDMHVANRGVDSLDGVIEAMAALIAAGKPVTAICVVRHGDAPMAGRLLKRARELGVRVHFQPQCLDTMIVRGALPKDASNERLRRFWSELLAMKAAGEPVASSTGYLQALAKWEDFSVSAIADPADRCAAGRGFLFVDPEGNAYPCAYTRGRTRPVNLLTEDWRTAWDRQTPCSRCSVGPMLEFNQLFQHPVAAVLDVARSYGSRTTLAGAVHSPP